MDLSLNEGCCAVLGFHGMLPWHSDADCSPLLQVCPHKSTGGPFLLECSLRLLMLYVHSDKMLRLLSKHTMLGMENVQDFCIDLECMRRQS